MRIIVPSLGRCGSTVVTMAIAAAFPELTQVFVRHPSKFPESGIIKTHCWAPKKLNEADKYVYVFGDPVLSAISAHLQSEAFQGLHYMHMGGSFELRQFWDTEDTLHLRQNYESWNQHRGALNLLFLGYDALFSEAAADSLSRFVGRKIVLPARVSRASIFDAANPKHVNAAKTYGDILGPSGGTWSI